MDRKPVALKHSRRSGGPGGHATHFLQWGPWILAALPHFLGLEKIGRGKCPYDAQRLITHERSKSLNSYFPRSRAVSLLLQLSLPVLFLPCGRDGGRFSPFLSKQCIFFPDICFKIMEKMPVVKCMLWNNRVWWEVKLLFWLICVCY